MKDNILIFSNFNLIENSQIWKDNSLNCSLKFQYIYDSNFTSFKKLSIHNLKEVFVLIYVNEFFNINYIRAAKFFIKIMKSRKDINFNFVFIKKNLKNNLIDKKNNIEFIKLLNHFKSDSLSNFKYSILSDNFEKNFSLRNEILLKMPFEYSFLTKLSKKIFSEIKNIIIKQFKIIFLDCDNTLWGGVAAEEGYNKVEYSSGNLGIAYEKFQKHLLYLKKQGFILTLVSKNEKKTVWETLKKRNMILQKKDFISSKINWRDKSSNIKETLKQLNLRPNDSIFVDDNYLELSKVKKNIKEISLVDSSDIIKCYETIMSHPRLQKKQILKEDTQKYKQYVIKDSFLKLSNSKLNDQAIFKKLKQKIYYQKISRLNIARAEQLFNKTNQFNFSLNRKSIREIIDLNKNKEVYIKLFGLKDLYGDHGLIGIYIIRKLENKIYLTDFLMSCRVIDRYIEYNVINNIFEDFKSKEVEVLYNRQRFNKNLVQGFLFKLLGKNKSFKKGRQKIKIEYKKSLSSYKKYFV